MRGRDETRRGQALAFSGIAIVASALSLAAFHHQLHALSVGGRDLGFFMAEYERLLDSPPWRELAVQPNGNNAFGFAGLDGHPTLHHDIHLSPLKYALAAVHAVTRSWLVVQLALVASMLGALAYVLGRWQRAAPGNALTLATMSAIALSPPFVRASCHDLRPAVALGAFVVVAAAALLSRAPRRHLWVIAGLGLLVREDAAVILALACAWLDVDGRRTTARRLYFVALAYVVGFHLLYLSALSFSYAPRGQTALVWAALLLYPALTLAPNRVRAPLRRMHGRHRPSAILLLGLPFAAVWLDPLFGGHLVRSAVSRSFPAVLVASLATTYWLVTAGSVRARRWATALALVAIVPAVALTLRMIGDLRAMAARHAPVWALASTVPDGTPILTDFANYQAFAGRDRLLVWERLPAAIEPTEAREFPASRDDLLVVLAEHEGLVVVSETSYAELTRTMRASGVERSFELCRRDGTLVVARASRHALCPAL